MEITFTTRSGEQMTVSVSDELRDLPESCREAAEDETEGGEVEAPVEPAARPAYP